MPESLTFLNSWFSVDLNEFIFVYFLSISIKSVKLILDCFEFFLFPSFSVSISWNVRFHKEPSLRSQRGNDEAFSRAPKRCYERGCAVPYDITSRESQGLGNPISMPTGLDSSLPILTSFRQTTAANASIRLFTQLIEFARNRTQWLRRNTWSVSLITSFFLLGGKMDSSQGLDRSCLLPKVRERRVIVFIRWISVTEWPRFILQRPLLSSKSRWNLKIFHLRNMRRLVFSSKDDSRELSAKICYED